MKQFLENYVGRACVFSLFACLGMAGSGVAQSPCYNDSMSPGPALKEWADTASTAATDVAAVAGIVNLASGGTAAPISAVVTVGAGAEAAYFTTVSKITDSFLKNAMGSPKPMSIDWGKLSATETILDLGDGDKIGIQKVSGGNKLMFEQSGTWWKGIVAFEKKDTNKWAEVACLQDDRKKMVVDMNASIGQDHYVVFSKAKTFGVHTNMYLIENWHDAPTNFTYVVNWKHD